MEETLGALTPTLSQALVSLCQERPAEPVQWLGEYLLAHKPPPTVEYVPAVTMLRSPSGMTIELEEGEELRCCTRCSKSFTTFSGSDYCVACRTEFMHYVLVREPCVAPSALPYAAQPTNNRPQHAVAQNEVHADEGEELKQCEKCRKGFVTLSGKTLCLSCRSS